MSLRAMWISFRHRNSSGRSRCFRPGGAPRGGGGRAAAPEPEGPKPREDGLPVQDPAKCIYCTLCAKKCPAGALAVDRAAKTWTLDEDKCIACGTCHDICPKKAIVM